ncbi:MAG: hypothetical protein ACE3L7_24830 [Candidatus Pristimantibacillus sp.]
MDVDKIQDEIDNLHYWDARVKKLSCEYFSDEVLLTYEDSEGDVSYEFTSCFKVDFKHVVEYKYKSSKELSVSQIPYFLQDVTVGTVETDTMSLYTCIINMDPLYVEIWCRDIAVNVSKS